MFRRIRDFFIVMICSLLLMEGVLRVVLFTDLINIPLLQKPWRYAYQDTDDLWKLQYIWSKQWGSSSISRVHPSLGWSQVEVTENNPLGLQSDSLDMLKIDNRSKVLFYGNSFVKGASEPEFQIPRYMNQKTPNADVIDLGVPGYGTDQIYLLFNETYRKVRDPLIIIGVLLGDIDRCVLSFRTSQKPYLSVSANGELAIDGVPIEKDQRRFLRSHPPQIKSYALSMIFRKLSFFKPNLDPRKKEINAKIIEKIHSTVNKENLALLYVIFYGIHNLENADWREKFLKEELTKFGIPFVDTKTNLIAYSRERNIPLSSFYVENEGHHNNLGNKVIAEAILKQLK